MDPRPGRSLVSAPDLRQPMASRNAASDRVSSSGDTAEGTRAKPRTRFLTDKVGPFELAAIRDCQGRLNRRRVEDDIKNTTAFGGGLR